LRFGATFRKKLTGPHAARPVSNGLAIQSRYRANVLHQLCLCSPRPGLTSNDGISWNRSADRARLTRSVGYTACREPCQLRNEAGRGSCGLGLAPYPPRAPTATRQPHPTFFDSVCIPSQRSWQSFGVLSPGLRNRNTASRLAAADTVRSRWLHLAAGHVSHNGGMVPVLFGTWRAAELPLYSPLLWTLQAVTRCPIHKCPLADRCPHCQSRFAPLRAKALPGQSSICSKPLGAANAPAITASADDQEYNLWSSAAIGQLLAAFPNLQKSSLPAMLRETYAGA
jgi:hypothetical protein